MSGVYILHDCMTLNMPDHGVIQYRLAAHNFIPCFKLIQTGYFTRTNTGWHMCLLTRPKHTHCKAVNFPINPNCLLTSACQLICMYTYECSQKLLIYHWVRILFSKNCMYVLYLNSSHAASTLSIYCDSLFANTNVLWKNELFRCKERYVLLTQLFPVLFNI